MERGARGGRNLCCSVSRKPRALGARRGAARAVNFGNCEQLLYYPTTGANNGRCPSSPSARSFDIQTDPVALFIPRLLFRLFPPFSYRTPFRKSAAGREARCTLRQKRSHKKRVNFPSRFRPFLRLTRSGAEKNRRFQPKLSRGSHSSLAIPPIASETSLLSKENKILYSPQNFP